MPAPVNLFPFVQAVTFPQLYTGVNPSLFPGTTYLFSGGEYHALLPGLRGESVIAGGPFCDYLGWRFSFSRFGIDEYREYSLSPGICTRFGRWASLGLSVEGYYISITDGKESAYERNCDLTIGFLLHPFSWLSLGAAGMNFLSAIRPERQNVLYPEYSAGCGISPFEGLTVEYNYTGTATGPLNTIGLDAALLDCLAVCIGYCPDSMESSVCMHLSYSRFLVSYRFRYHPALGTTHGLGLTMAMDVKRFTPLSYADRKPDPSDKRDISQITDEEILALPFLTGEEAEKLLRYRRENGHLSIDTLYAIGLERERVKRLLDSFYGFEDERDRPGAIKKTEPEKRERMIDRQRTAFRAFISLGIAPARAMELVDLARFTPPGEMDVRLRAMGGLSDEKIKAALVICAGLYR